MGCVAAGASVAAAAIAGASAPRAQFHDFACHHAVSPISRRISVWAVMRPVPGTRKLEERWVLLSRTTPGGAFTAVSGNNLGSWKSPSNPTLGQQPGDVWELYKYVSDLAAPAAYRLQATFRWLGDHDRVLATTQRTTPMCMQPELRPDLAVQSIVVEAIPDKPTKDRYVATIVNNGATRAGPFLVSFAPGGGLPVTNRLVSHLRAHGQLVESFVGPACSTTSATTVTADPDGQVNDYNRSNNQLTAVCTAAPTPSSGAADRRSERRVGAPAGR